MNWISCLDELPDKQDMYLVTWTGKLGSLEPGKWLGMIEYTPGTGWESYDLYKMGYKDIQVIAWMDLPNVYDAI